MIDTIIDAINNVIENVGSTVQTVIGLLPGSPFRAITNYLNTSIPGFPDWLAMLNWFIPFAEIVALLELWGVSVGIWYALSVALRWIRAVE